MVWRAYQDETHYGKWWVENTETGWKTSAAQGWAVRVIPSDDERRALAYAAALQRADETMDKVEE